MLKVTMLLLLLSVWFSFVYSEILTVDNNIPSIGQYQTLQAAYEDAQPDDIIYLYPSQISHPALSIAKKVTIYGVGWSKHSESTLVRYSSITEVNFNNGSQNSLIMGLYIRGQCNVNVNANAISIKNCYISSLAIHGNNSLIESSELPGTCHICSGAQACIISKCFIPGQAIVLNGSSSTFINNIFSSPSSYQYIAVETNAICSFIRNTIHPRSSFAPSGMIFEHNLLMDVYPPVSAYHNTLLQSGNSYWFFVQENTSLSNPQYWIENLNPTDINYHIRDLPSADVIEYIYLFDGNGNPYITGIPDTTPPDDGAYTGSDPFDDNYNIPDLPTVVQMIIENNVVHANQPIQVDIKAQTK